MGAYRQIGFTISGAGISNDTALLTFTEPLIRSLDSRTPPATPHADQAECSGT